MQPRYLNQKELAERWGISPRTLERWRWQGTGPDFVRIGGQCRYRLDEIETFEAESRPARLARAS